MKLRPPTLRPRHAAGPRAAARRGFSFTEVLFAVMILGIGFIMIAGMFPVAIQQARTTSEEGNAAAIARGAVKFIEENLTGVDMPALGQPGQIGPVLSFRDPQAFSGGGSGGGGPMPTLISESRRGPGNDPPRWPLAQQQLWNKVSGNLVIAADPRYAWVPLYRRDRLAPTAGAPLGIPAPYAQVFIVVTQVRDEIAGPTPAARRSGTTYDARTDVNVVGSPAATAMVNLQAKPVTVSIDGGAQQITFTGTPIPTAVAEGTYVIIARDNLQLPNSNRMNGRIYRVGNHVGGDVWDLMPGNDFVIDPGANGKDERGLGDDITGLTRANAFIVGRTLTDSRKVTFAGAAQDIAVYTTFIQMK